MSKKFKNVILILINKMPTDEQIGDLVLNQIIDIWANQKPLPGLTYITHMVMKYSGYDTSRAIKFAKED